MLGKRYSVVAFIILSIVLSFSGCSKSGADIPFSASTITGFNIISRTVVYDGKSFGSVGQYELILAQATGVLNPLDSKNKVIVNLDKAPRNQNGLIEYSVDVHILKPVDMTKSNHKILYDVVNRGSKLAPSVFNGQTAWTSAGSGTDYLQNKGYTVVWSGWQGDVAMPAAQSASSSVGTNFPVAVNSDGSDVTGLSREEYVDQTANPFTATLTYPAASSDKTGATLTVRENETDARVAVPAANWDYVAGSGNKQIRVTKVAGYDYGAIYEFIYTAKSPTVMGIGFAAVRDLVSFLKYDGSDSNPLKGAIAKAIVFGFSQSGRFIRDYVYQGFNLNTNNVIVFEGAMPAAAGARRTFTNYAFAQPGRFTRQHEDHLYPQDSFPFTYGTLVDPVSGLTDGIFTQCMATVSCPYLFHVDTDSEVWQGHNSLIATDTTGAAITLPSNVRAFLLAGICHVPGTVSPFSVQATNTLLFRAPMRALLTSLDNWVANGATPLASKWPTPANGTYVTLATAGTQWPAGIPSWPWSDKINSIEVRNYNVLPPAIISAAYPLYVPKFNAYGNTVEGTLVYPEVNVPVGTYSGRSIRKSIAAPGEISNVVGGYRQFELTAAARAASGDPRPSLEELYPGGNAAYQAALVDAANALVAQGYMLAEDVAGYATKTLPTTPPTP